MNIRKDLNGGPATKPAVEKIFNAILAPIREGFARSSMTEEEITALFEEAREEVRQDRRARKGAS